ncbi:MAG: F0F1 ATP synthase subunit delta [Elusimicrobia bacterium]|nr:F0F1 ATP synthase subunit delta [Elusimicrobiota bacterium]
MNLNDRVISKKYAMAYFMSSGEDEELKKNNLKKIINETADVMDYFINPVINLEIKLTILDRVISSEIKGSLSEKLFSILISTKRIALVESISEEFEKIYLDSKKMTQLELRAKYSLDDFEKKAISDNFKAVTGKTPVIKFVQDKNIIGGFLMKWDDKVFNSTINQKIESLKDKIISKEIL